MRTLICLALLCLNVAVLPSAPVSLQPSSGTLRVISYNILHGTNQQNEDALTSQGLAIKQLRPDLVGLQEVDDQCSRSGSIDQMKKLAAITGMHSAFGAHMPYQGGEYGLGLLSRYPLSDVRTDKITLVTKENTTETRALLSATVTLDNGTTVRLATVHMALTQQSRMLQAAEIIDYLKPDAQTVILTGDFNAQPDTEEINRLESVFVNLGDPKAHTFPVSTPDRTIDYIMVSKSTSGRGTSFKVHGEVRHSDHYPISVELSF